MGLDSYVRVTVNESDDVIEELWYGRKENEIHGWMQQKSGIDAEDFNLVRLYLTKGLLDSLEADIKSFDLVPTAGFFFGRANPENEVTAAAAKLIAAARKALIEGKSPYYTSWW